MEFLFVIHSKEDLEHQTTKKHPMSCTQISNNQPHNLVVAAAVAAAGSSNHTSQPNKDSSKQKNGPAKRITPSTKKAHSMNVQAENHRMGPEDILK
jgi:hypothetical protein